MIGWFNLRATVRALFLLAGVELIAGYGDWREILGAVCVGVYAGTSR